VGVGEGCQYLADMCACLGMCVHHSPRLWCSFVVVLQRVPSARVWAGWMAQCVQGDASFLDSFMIRTPVSVASSQLACALHMLIMYVSSVLSLLHQPDRQLGGAFPR
jgi:hypothetical protein